MNRGTVPKMYGIFGTSALELPIALEGEQVVGDFELDLIFFPAGDLGHQDDIAGRLVNIYGR